MPKSPKHLVSYAAMVAALGAIVAVPLFATSAGAADDHGVTVGTDSRHDVSPPLSQLASQAAPATPRAPDIDALNPRIPHTHVDAADPAVQSRAAAPNMPAPILNFNGIQYPGVNCFCAPPDTNGEVGATQYVQIVNEGLQVFDKGTGASLLGPISITSLWSGFGGVCETAGDGDPVILYDQIAGRWVVTQFAGSGVPTDECIAVSTTSDATGTFNRYDFHLGSNFFDYPKLGVWPDAYYMAMNVFNSSGTAFLGPQPFAFDRSAMLAGTTATFVTTGIAGAGANEETFLPADLDGSTLPPAGAPNSFVEWPGGASGNNYKVWHFHVDFANPTSSTFTQFATVAAAGFTQLCATAACIPQPSTGSKLDALGDRLMFRAAYRNFGDHESLVSNYSVSTGNGAKSRAGVRWFELRNVTNGPVTKYQESTYAPNDGVYRWMGSAAMDKNGDLAVGFSTSNKSTVFPSLRYAGRLSTDPLNNLSQGEAVLYDGQGSQSGTSNRWGDYSDLTIDPVDDCTFWYTNEYYPTGVSQFNWRTRIGKFKFTQCT